MPGRSFVLIVVDRDTSEFTAEGPMIDDRPWNKAVVEAQKDGRNIRCFGMGDVPPTPPRPNGEKCTAAGGLPPGRL